ncbi:MAG: hypothetical protein ACLTCB_04950 [Merdibacter sp.]
MHHVYIDNEFDAVRIDGRNMQQVIALGAVICDARYQEVGRFYSLVRPMGFQRLSYHVRRMTHLHDHDIRRASAFPQVMDTFIALLREYDPLDQIKIYSFGPDDGRTLCANAGAYHHERAAVRADHRPAEPDVLWVTYQGEVFHKAFSLEALKLVYHVRGEVNHNALSDAVDLYRVHEAYRQERELDEEQVSALYAAMMQRRAQGERKRREIRRAVSRRWSKDREVVYGCIDPFGAGLAMLPRAAAGAGGEASVRCPSRLAPADLHARAYFCLDPQTQRTRLLLAAFRLPGYAAALLSAAVLWQCG